MIKVINNNYNFTEEILSITAGSDRGSYAKPLFVRALSSHSRLCESELSSWINFFQSCRQGSNRGPSDKKATAKSTPPRGTHWNRIYVKEITTTLKSCQRIIVQAPHVLQYEVWSCETNHWKDARKFDMWYLFHYIRLLVPFSLHQTLFIKNKVLMSIDGAFNQSLNIQISAVVIILFSDAGRWKKNLGMICSPPVGIGLTNLPGY